MHNRAIVIYPKFKNVKVIQAIREKNDPLCSYIDPHITLVFPFESALSKSEVEEHVKNSLVGIPTFSLMMKGVTGSPEGYIFLDVKQGNDWIVKVHDRLYEGCLKEHHNRFIPYFPHLTLGRISDPEKQMEAMTPLFDFDEIFEAEVEEIVVVELGKDKAMEESKYKFNIIHEKERER